MVVHFSVRRSVLVILCPTGFDCHQSTVQLSKLLLLIGPGWWLVYIPFWAQFNVRVKLSVAWLLFLHNEVAGVMSNPCAVWEVCQFKYYVSFNLGGLPNMTSHLG